VDKTHRRRVNLLREKLLARRKKGTSHRWERAPVIPSFHLEGSCETKKRSVLFETQKTARRQEKKEGVHIQWGGEKKEVLLFSMRGGGSKPECNEECAFLRLQEESNKVWPHRKRREDLA